MPIPDAIIDTINQQFADVTDDQMRKRLCALAEELYKVRVIAAYFRDDNRKMRDQMTLLIQQLQVSSETNLRLTRMLQRTARRVVSGAPSDVRDTPVAPKRFV